MLPFAGWGSADSGKALFQVCQNILNMLRADGQPDGVGFDAAFQQLLLRQLGVGGG